MSCIVCGETVSGLFEYCSSECRTAIRSWRILIGSAGASFPSFVATASEAVDRFRKAERENPRVVLTLIEVSPIVGQVQRGGHTIDGDLWGMVA